MTPEESIKLDIISSYIGNPLTEEQKEFASDFTKPVISFSDPGTGKTHTLIAGLVMAQAYHKVPGKTIDCMSFTRAATAEMAARYEKLCRRCSVPPTVQFNTFHSLSNAIMHKAYPRMRIVKDVNMQDAIPIMSDILRQNGIDITENDMSYVRRVIKAVNTLNSALCFHPDNLSKRYDFMQLNLPVETFQNIRKSWFLHGIINSEIPQGDIPLYCLYALMTNKDIISEWKHRYEIMVVDEFQDLSLLHLHILSYISNVLIVIGDMKQQIYAFNGACPQIVEKYMEMYPNAKVANLTKSFRCGQNIADFATKIIKGNYQDIEPFIGSGSESSVEIYQRSEINWEKIAQDINDDITKRSKTAISSYMFLYRNNASSIPIVEELYERGIQFRCPKYKTVMEVPMFETIDPLVQIAWQPQNPDIVNTGLRKLPEFKNTPYGTDTAPVQVMKMTGNSFFDINFQYRDEATVMAVNVLRGVRESIENKETAGHVYNKIWPFYKKYLYDSDKWKLDNEPEFYINLVAPVVNKKSYPKMVSEEIDKRNKNINAINAGFGIRCYTMHSAKGLEADYVYILDCDEGTFPNKSVMDKKAKANCYYDIALDIRSERNLLYVAVTRAKYKVVITYSGNQLARLISDPDAADIKSYDNIYYQQNELYDDANVFFDLFRVKRNEDNIES